MGSLIQWLGEAVLTGAGLADRWLDRHVEVERRAGPDAWLPPKLRYRPSDSIAIWVQTARHKVTTRSLMMR
jgi:hypothetical protein